jgi:hypothetical protein
MDPHTEANFEKLLPKVRKTVSDRNGTKVYMYKTKSGYLKCSPPILAPWSEGNDIETSIIH